MLLTSVSYCVLLGCQSLIHVVSVTLFVIHVWQPRFPLNGIDLTRLLSAILVVAVVVVYVLCCVVLCCVVCVCVCVCVCVLFP